MPEATFKQLEPDALRPTALADRDDPALYIDQLHGIFCQDHGPAAGLADLLYVFRSAATGAEACYKVTISRQPGTVVPSLAGIYPSANWQEREIYDMFGFVFEGHPDLRRILMPADWPGYPLRKDAEDPTQWHGIGMGRKEA